MMTPLGDPGTFINDDKKPTLIIDEATATPLDTGSRTGDISIPQLHVPKTKVHIVIIGNYTAAEARPMPKTALMACFTNTFIIRGNYHMSPEMNGPEVFFEGRGIFFPVTVADIFNHKQLTNPIEGNAELLYINGALVEMLYEDN